MRVLRRLLRGVLINASCAALGLNFYLPVLFAHSDNACRVVECLNASPMPSARGPMNM